MHSITCQHKTGFVKKLVSFSLALMIGVGGSIPLLFSDFGSIEANAYTKEQLFGNAAYDNTLSRILSDAGWEPNTVYQATSTLINMGTHHWLAPADMKASLDSTTFSADMLRSRIYLWVQNALLAVEADYSHNSMSTDQAAAHKAYKDFVSLKTNPNFVNYVTSGLRGQLCDGGVKPGDEWSSVIKANSNITASMAPFIDILADAGKDLINWFFHYGSKGFIATISADNSAGLKSINSYAKETWEGIQFPFEFSNTECVNGIIAMRSVGYVVWGQWDLIREASTNYHVDDPAGQYYPTGVINQDILWDPQSAATLNSMNTMIIATVLAPQKEAYVKSHASLVAFGVDKILDVIRKPLGLADVDYENYKVSYPKMLGYDEAVAKWKTLPAELHGLIPNSSQTELPKAWGSLMLMSADTTKLKLDYITYHLLKCLEYGGSADQEGFFTAMASFLLSPDNATTLEWFKKNFVPIINPGSSGGLTDEEAAEGLLDYLYNGGYELELRNTLSYFNQKYPDAALEVTTGKKLEHVANATPASLSTVGTALRDKIATQYAIVQVLRERLPAIIGQTPTVDLIVTNKKELGKQLISSKTKNFSIEVFNLLTTMNTLNSALGSKLATWSSLASASAVTPSMTQAAVMSTTVNNAGAQTCSVCASLSEATNTPTIFYVDRNPWRFGLNSAVFRHMLEAHSGGTLSKVVLADDDLKAITEFVYMFGAGNIDEPLSLLSQISDTLAEPGTQAQKDKVYKLLTKLWKLPITTELGDTTGWMVGTALNTHPKKGADDVPALRAPLVPVMDELSARLDGAVKDWGVVSYNTLTDALSKYAEMAKALTTSKLNALALGDYSLHDRMELLSSANCTDIMDKIVTGKKAIEYHKVKLALGNLGQFGGWLTNTYYEPHLYVSSLSTPRQIYPKIEAQTTWAYLPSTAKIVVHRNSLGEAIRDVCKAEPLKECAAVKPMADAIPSSLPGGLSPTALLTNSTELFKHFVKDHLKTSLPATDPGTQPPPTIPTPPVVVDKWVMPDNKVDLLGWVLHRPGFASTIDQQKSVLDDTVTSTDKGKPNPKFSKGNYNPGLTELTKKEHEVNFWGNALAVVFYTVGEILLLMGFFYTTLFVLVRTSGFMPASWFRFCTFGKLDPYELSIPKFITSIILVTAFACIFVSGWAYQGATSFVAWLLTNFNLL